MLSKRSFTDEAAFSPSGCRPRVYTGQAVSPVTLPVGAAVLQVLVPGASLGRLALDHRMAVRRRTRRLLVILRRPVELEVDPRQSMMW